MFSFRPADINDRFLINSLASGIWHETYGCILSEEQSRYMFDRMYAPDNILKQMTKLHHRYFIVSSDGIPSGYLSIEQRDDNTCIFQKVYALPCTHGTGIGRYLIEQGVAWLKSIRLAPFTILLYVNRENPAVGFYKHVGFRQAGERDYAIGNGYYMNDYVMTMDVEGRNDYFI
ncbi:Acetyltransferase (GNAT) family protein [Bacteroidales bacterium Barb6]|nr:Acetyltransferase (GNAT) family protein [Bacteroidales bacterium Barb6]